MRLFALLAFLLAPAVVGAATHVDDAAELEVLNRINCERADLGLAPLRVDGELASLARYHSADMALSGFVNELSPESGALLDRAKARAGVQDAGRVLLHVAAGTDPMRSSVSLLDPALTRVGIGVVAEGGRVFITQVAVADPTSERASYTAASHADAARFIGMVRMVLFRADGRVAASLR